MLGKLLVLGGVILGVNIIGYKLYCDNNNEKLRKKYDEANKKGTVITLKPEDIKEVK